MVSLLNVCRRSIRCAFKLVAWVPVLFIVLVLVWGYYVYVYIIQISGSFSDVSYSPVLATFLKVFFLLSAHAIFILQITSYIRTIFTKHKAIPDQFLLSDDHLDQLEQSVDEQTVLREVASRLPVHQLSRGRTVRYCSHCELMKPDRCHHCSICNRCVLKMDHHCPWVNNCVGYSNHKFFVLFLMYSVGLCLWLCITSIHAFITAWAKDTEITTAQKFQVIFWYFVCSMFGLSTAILFCFHVYLILYNKTTLENMQPPHVEGITSHRPYFVSFKSNVRQVFGKSRLLALLPLFTSEGNGMVYPLLGMYRSAILRRTSTQSDGSCSENEHSENEFVEFISEREPLT